MPLRWGALMLALLSSVSMTPVAAQAPGARIGVAPAAPPPLLSGVVAPAPVPMGLSEYLVRVARSNLELAAQRSNVSIAEAQVVMARIFPDPQLSAGLASFDVTRKGAPASIGVGLSETFELGGKRGARVRAAEASRSVAEAEVADYLRQLRATAANAFIDAVAARLSLEQQRRSLAGLERLVSVNEERVRAGDLGEIALVKTRVEAEQFKSDVLTAEGELTAAQYALTLYLGSAQAPGGVLPEVQGDLNIAARELSSDALLEAAKKQRPDLVARRLSVRAAAAGVDLARANRSIDVNAGVGWQHSWPASNAFTQPSYDSVSATLTVPLPLSRMYPGELQAARASVEQAKLLLGSAELRVEVELKQALARYRAALARVRLYSGGTVAEADRVFEASVYNYQRGGATLLEVLDAQRTRNDVYLSYLDALRGQARALVDVQTAAGQWDIQL